MDVVCFFCLVRLGRLGSTYFSKRIDIFWECDLRSNLNFSTLFEYEVRVSRNLNDGPMDWYF